MNKIPGKARVIALRLSTSLTGRGASLINPGMQQAQSGPTRCCLPAPTGLSVMPLFAVDDSTGDAPLSRAG